MSRWTQTEQDEMGKLHNMFQLGRISFAEYHCALLPYFERNRGRFMR